MGIEKCLLVPNCVCLAIVKCLHGDTYSITSSSLLLFYFTTLHTAAKTYSLAYLSVAFDCLLI
jgi:hypothetical protein